MSNTGIPYLTKTWNFQTGCLHGIEICPCSPDCWARGNYHRFGRDYNPKLHPQKLLEPLSWRKPQRVGVCFTGDLFGDWVEPSEAMVELTGYGRASLHYQVKCILSDCPQHQFFFLTKNPAGYAQWGKWPDNAWIGATVCNDKMLDVAVDKLEDIQAKHKWLSFEPLMHKLTLSLDYAMYYSGVSWVVIGGWSTQAQRKKHELKIEWIKEIVEACDKAGIPVWLKDNLRPLFLKETLKTGGKIYEVPEWAGTERKTMLRQELPEVKG